MKAQTPRQHGFFLRAGRQYISLSEAARMPNLTASELADAIALGELPVERVSGLKIVSVQDLFDYIDRKETQK
jgi:hypothetical protein